MRSALKALTPPLLWSLGKVLQRKVLEAQGKVQAPFKPEARHGRFAFENQASFYSLYNDYFINERYKFECGTKRPLIIDGGANIGISCRYWKDLYPEAEVLAFEPDEKNFVLLQKNVKGLTNITAENKALWSSHGVLKFKAVGGEGGHVANAKSHAGKDQIVKVPSFRLRDLLNRKVDLLKLDIEGSEMEVLRDCKDLLGNVEKIFVEHHSFLGQPQQLGELFGILETAGFRINIHVDIVSQQPFIKRTVFNNKDCWINIFAFRETK